jgi:hypothetical protein
VQIKKILSMLVAAAMLAGLLSTATYALAFSDMPGDRSKIPLQNAVQNGLLSGYGGKIMPESSLTRAEMAAVVNRAFGSQVKADISGYTDVPSAKWYSGDMAKAVHMGIFKGYGGKLNPDTAITRQEVFVTIARAIKLKPENSVSKQFSDLNDLSSWAKGEVFAMINAGYVSGSGGKINPGAKITRAEFAVVMDNVIKEYITVAKEVTQVKDGNVMISVPGVTLKNVTVKGDLIIGDGVGDGEVTLDGVTVTGRTVVRGGGTNSIRIIGASELGQVIVSRMDGEVRVAVSGDADVQVIVVDDGSDDVLIEGRVNSVEIQAPGITVTVGRAQIGSITVAGENTKVVVGQDAAVTTLTITAPGAAAEVSGTIGAVETSNGARNVAISTASTAKIGVVKARGAGAVISGTGSVKKVEANADNIRVTTPNTSVAAGAGTTGVTAGGTGVNAGTSATTNSTGTGAAADITGTATTTAPPSSGGGDGSEDPAADTTAPTATAAAIGNTIILTFSEAVDLYKDSIKVTSGSGAEYKAALKTVAADDDTTLLAINAAVYSGRILQITMADRLTVGTTYYVSFTGSESVVYTVKDSSGNAFTPGNGRVSVIATLPAAPLIATQPADAAKIAGETATFNLVLSAVPSGTVIHYQWQLTTGAGASWENISGANAASYTTQTLAATDNNSKYRCVVTAEQYGAISAPVESSPATLTVLDTFAVSIATDISGKSQGKLWTGDNALSGDKTANVTVTVTNTTGQAVSGAKVVLSSSGGAVVVSNPTATTGENGAAAFTINTAAAGDAILTATVTKDGFAVNNTAVQAVTVANAGDIQLTVGGIAAQTLTIGTNATVSVSLSKQSYNEAVASGITDHTGFVVQVLENSAVTGSYNNAAKTLTLAPKAVTAGPVAVTLRVGKTGYQTAIRTFNVTVNADPSNALVSSEAELRVALGDSGIISITVNGIDGELYIVDPLAITKPLFIPEGQHFGVIGSTVVIGDGVTVTNNGEIIATKGAHLSMGAGASVVGTGYSNIYAAAKTDLVTALAMSLKRVNVYVYGPISFGNEIISINKQADTESVTIYLDNGYDGGTGDFLDYENVAFGEGIEIIGHAGSEAAVRSFVQNPEIWQFMISGAVTLSQPMSIEGHKWIRILDDATFTVPAGEAFTLGQDVQLDIEGTLNNMGSITNNGSIIMWGGTLNNQGSITNSGTIRVEDGGSYTGALPTGHELDHSNSM